MKIGIFYISLNNAPDRQPIHVPGQLDAVWIRVEAVEGENLDEDALAKTKPRADEAVMNTHPVTAEGWMR
jgi:hypothetical protein